MIYLSKTAARAILNDTNRSLMEREQAVHTLGNQPTAEDLNRLVEALQDNEFGVRWAAAVMLAQAGDAAFEPLLRALVAHAGSVWLREGAYHVLHYTTSDDMADRTKSLMEALKGPAADLATTMAAGKLLRALEKEHQVN